MKSGCLFIAMILFVGGFPSIGDAADAFRTFTDAKGREIMAKVVAVKGKDVIITKKSGKQFKFPIATLSEADQAYLKKWQAENVSLDFEIKCVKQPVRNVSGPESKWNTKVKTSAYRYEVTLTNKSFKRIPELELRYRLFTGTQGSKIRGTEVNEAGKGKFKIPQIEPHKSGSGVTIHVAGDTTVEGTEAKLPDGSTARSFTKTRVKLAGIALEIYHGDVLVKTHTHGRVIEPEDVKK